MKFILQLVGFGHHFKHLNTRSSHRRRNRVGEKIRTRALTQQVYNLLLPCGKTTDCPAKSFAQSAGNNFDISFQSETFGNSTTGSAHYTCRVRFIHHHHGIVLFGKSNYFIHRSHIAVHREHTIGYNQSETTLLCRLKLLFQVGHIGIGITIPLCFAQTHTVNDRSMIERIGDYRIFVGKQWFEHTTVGIETGSIQNGVFSVEEFSYFCLQRLVSILRSANKPHRCHAITPFVESSFGSFNQFRIVSQPKVIVGTKVQHLSTIHLYFSSLSRFNHSFSFIQARGLYRRKLLL